MRPSDVPLPSPPVRIWLWTMAALVLLILVVGGVTRLTRSGLSMVTWRPIAGVLPPTSRADWEAAFARYKRYPEYQKVNRGMTLAQFKRIFFWEYLHRLLGRLVGVAFFFPWLWFVLRRQVQGPWIWKTAIAFVLGGLQGLLGWYMVKSGLVNVPHVSHYRLAAHLLLAFLILQYLLWLAWSTARKGPRQVEPQGRLFSGLATTLIVLITIQILYGALTAGLKAGYGYNTFPLMGDRWLPAEAWSLQPAWLNLFDNRVMLQFLHRSLGWIVALAGFGVGGFVFLRSGERSVRLAAAHMVAAIAVQFLLGVFTLLYVVPITLATLHQLGAALLLTASVYLRFTVSGQRSQDQQSMPAGQA